MRLYGKRTAFGERLAFAIADRLERSGVTDVDIDRVTTP
jgi:hypothetical protein